MKKTTVAAIALITVAASWGFAFVWMKNTIQREPYFDFLALRFTLAAGIMFLARPQLVKSITAKFLARGSLLGLALGLGYVTQTIGLELSTAAITGFFTGLYIVLTPLFAWLLLRQKVSLKVGISVALATVGLAFITLGGLGFDFGTISLLVCAVLFALHIVGLGKWSPGSDTYALTVIQLASVAVVCWVGALFNPTDPGFQVPPDQDVWNSIFFTAIFATAIAFFVQTWAQSIMDASRVAIILTSEVIFAAVFAVMTGQEVLQLRTIIGGALMVSAMLIVEWPSKQLKPDDVTPGLDPMVH
ncbi:MAG: DMT family transporter [Microbacteriaceae bacterium]